MAVTVAHSDVAMKKWLCIVGAERSGRTAVPHRHGKIVDLYSARLFRLSCGEEASRSKACPSCFLNLYTTTLQLSSYGIWELTEMFRMSMINQIWYNVTR